MAERKLTAVAHLCWIGGGIAGLFLIFGPGLRFSTDIRIGLVENLYALVFGVAIIVEGLLAALALSACAEVVRVLKKNAGLPYEGRIKGDGKPVPRPPGGGIKTASSS